MGKPKTLLEGLCGHALSLGADSISVEYRDGREWVLAQRGGAGMKIAAYPGTGADARELRQNLHAAAWRRRLRGPYRTRARTRFLGPAILHTQTGPIPGLHSLLLEDPSASSVRVRSPALFPGVSSVDTPDDRDSRAQRPHRAHRWAGPLDTAPGAAGTPVGAGLSSTLTFVGERLVRPGFCGAAGAGHFGHLRKSLRWAAATGSSLLQTLQAEDRGVEIF